MARFIAFNESAEDKLAVALAQAGIRESAIGFVMNVPGGYFDGFCSQRKSEAPGDSFRSVGTGHSIDDADAMWHIFLKSDVPKL